MPISAQENVKYFISSISTCKYVIDMYLFYASKPLKGTACCRELFSCGFFTTIRTKLCCTKFRGKVLNIEMYYSNNTLRSPVVFRAAATFHVGLALEVGRGEILGRLVVVPVTTCCFKLRSSSSRHT